MLFQKYRYVMQKLSQIIKFLYRLGQIIFFIPDWTQAEILAFIPGLSQAKFLVFEMGQAGTLHFFYMCKPRPKNFRQCRPLVMIAEIGYQHELSCCRLLISNFLIACILLFDIMGIFKIIKYKNYVIFFSQQLFFFFFLQTIKFILNTMYTLWHVQMHTK